MRYLFVLLVLTGCPRPLPPKPPEPDPDAERVMCKEEAQTLSDDACPGFFTAEGFVCTRCKNVSACIAEEIQVYCVQGRSCLDPKCLPESFSTQPSLERSPR